MANKPTSDHIRCTKLVSSINEPEKCGLLNEMMAKNKEKCLKSVCFLVHYRKRSFMLKRLRRSQILIFFQNIQQNDFYIPTEYFYVFYFYFVTIRTAIQ